jgi:dynein heavy chain
MRHERGVRRMLKNQTDEQDPVQKYRDSIEQLQGVQDEITNHLPVKPVLFVNLDCTKLKESLRDAVHLNTQTIYQHLISEAKKDLNDLIESWGEIITTLKQPANTLQLLKDNKKLLEDVKEKIPVYDQKRDPIKLKFKYIAEQEDVITSNDLTEEDKAKKEALDDHFQRFKDGLEEAEANIRKYTQNHKQEVDSSIEEFKKLCIDTRNNFK